MLGIGTPLLWRNATAESLLGLIDCAYLCWGPNDALFFITFDAYTADNETFKRFHSYAPYVQNLEIYDGKYGCCYTVEGWNVLLNEIEVQGRPLLPNLKSLRFLDISPSHGFNELRWISVFATPGVKEVSLVPSQPSPSGQIPFSVGSTILEALVDLCPNIQTLDLSTSDSCYPARFSDARFRMALAHRPTRPWYQELRRLTQLRHLTISEGWLYPDCFQILGCLPELESLAIIPGQLDEFDYAFEMNPVLPNGSFDRLTNLSILGLESYGIEAILEVKDIFRQITTMKLEFYFDEPEGYADGKYLGIQGIFKGLRNASYLRELHISFPFQPEEGERPANAYHVMEDMGLHPFLESVHLDGIRIDKGYRRACHAIRDLAAIWPNVHTLSMPSQHASIRDLEDFATLPSLRHLTVKLDLKYPYLPTKPEFKIAPLKSLTSSGPVRLSATYKHLSLSADALLRLWPSLQQVTWTDEDTSRMEMAHFFNSQVLPFSRKCPFGTPRRAQLPATRKARKMKAFFKLILEDLEEADSDSDPDSDSDTEEY
ncbi:hypothetical protein V565_090140 [Rhizoctonia solani 123E]|uniref:F-box-like domain protein n=1 Tax=Rhizoctonia solani 123E TaxID=1423351 RepID=A0A074SIV6_9AGAM|nr:hypothetical protein V565_090140 [Rhizoctonia solani 123E]